MQSNQLEQAIANFGPYDMNNKLRERRVLMGKIAVKPPPNGLLNKTFLREKFISPDVCTWIISKSEDYAANNGGWTKKRHKHYPTTDLPVRSIQDLHIPLFNLTTINILPLISEYYKVNLYFLSICDLFIVKYEMGDQEHLEKHRDGSIISFNILLNDEFEGGGTNIEHTTINNRTENTLYTSKKGDLFIHPGRLIHGGNKITSGKRYILVGFIEFYKSEHFRRHLEEKDEKDEKKENDHLNEDQKKEKEKEIQDSQRKEEKEGNEGKERNGGNDERKPVERIQRIQRFQKKN